MTCNIYILVKINQTPRAFLKNQKELQNMTLNIHFNMAIQYEWMMCHWSFYLYFLYSWNVRLAIFSQCY